MVIENTSAQDSSKRALWYGVREPVISAFIVFNVAAIALVLSPPFPMRKELLDPVLPYLYATGLFQGSGVFVPHPHVYNLFLTAEVTFADGSTVIWHCPRMEELNLIERFQKERYRKWSRQNMDTPKPLSWWPETAAYIARITSKGGKRPVQVALIRHRTETPAPGSSKEPLPIDDVFYIHSVSAEELK